MIILEPAGARSSKVPKTSIRGPEKLFVKLRPSYSVKLVFLLVVKGIKIKIIATFRAWRRLHSKDTKRISREMRPKSSQDFSRNGPRYFLPALCHRRNITFPREMTFFPALCITFTPTTIHHSSIPLP